MVRLPIQAGKFCNGVTKSSALEHDRHVLPAREEQAESRSLSARILADGSNFPQRSGGSRARSSIVSCCALQVRAAVHGDHPAYLIANAFGGEPTPPGTFSGAEVRKKS